MFRAVKWSFIPLFAFALALSVSATARAEEAKKETGSVSGTVLDKDGKAVSGAQVRLMRPMERGARRGPNAETQNAAPAEKPGKGQRPARGDRPKPIATATTDANGQFTLSDVPVGKYVVMAGVRGQGMARDQVEVTAGGTATVELKLQDRPAKGGAGNKAPKKGQAPAVE